MKNVLYAGLALSLLFLATVGWSQAHVVMQTLNGDRSVTDGYRLNVSVGGGPQHIVLVDSGSVGIVVPRSVLGPQARSTRRSGRIEYTSSGRVFTGTYYDAPITIIDARGQVVSTASIEVLAIDAGSCDPGHINCRAAEGIRGVGMMGVGFARDTGSPAVNPFLHLIGHDGSPLSAAYLIRRDSILLGADLRDERNYSLISLRRAPGARDWDALSGCFTRDTSRRFCGSVLLDTGVSDMLLRVPPAERAPYSSSFSGAAIKVSFPSYPSRRPPGAAVDFTAIVGSTSAPIAPPSARWSDASGGYFLNTGRSPLAAYDYLYDSGRGVVGFFRRP